MPNMVSLGVHWRLNTCRSNTFTQSCIQSFFHVTDTNLLASRHKPWAIAGQTNSIYTHLDYCSIAPYKHGEISSPLTNKCTWPRTRENTQHMLAVCTSLEFELKKDWKIKYTKSETEKTCRVRYWLQHHGQPLLTPSLHSQNPSFIFFTRLTTEGRNISIPTCTGHKARFHPGQVTSPSHS